MINIVLLGPPGAGKGTQSKKLIQQYKLIHISPGESLREQVEKSTSLGQQVEAYINEGKLVPPAIVTDMVEAQLSALKKEGYGFLFDGFPRTVSQAVAIEEQLTKQHLQIDAIVLLEIPEEELFQRVKLRAQIAGRADDQDDYKIATRIRIYREETLLVNRYYAKKDKLFKIDGVGEIDVIFRRITAIMEQLLARAISV